MDFQSTCPTAHHEDLFTVTKTYIWLDVVKDSPCVQQSYHVSSHQTPKGVAGDAQFVYSLPSRFQFLDAVFDLLRDTFTANLNPIICRVSNILFCNENFKEFVRIGVAKGGGEALKM